MHVSDSMQALVDTVQPQTDTDTCRRPCVLGTGHASLRQHKKIGDAKLSMTLPGGFGNAAARDRQAPRCCQCQQKGAEKLVCLMISQAKTYIYRSQFMFLELGFKF